MNMKSRENGYLPAAAFMRTDRVVMQTDGYYYKTREEGIVGPFATRSLVNFELNIFMNIKQIEKELINEDPLKVA